MADSPEAVPASEPTEEAKAKPSEKGDSGEGTDDAEKPEGTPKPVELLQDIAEEISAGRGGEDAAKVGELESRTAALEQRVEQLAQENMALIAALREKQAASEAASAPRNVVSIAEDLPAAAEASTTPRGAADAAPFGTPDDDLPLVVADNAEPELEPEYEDYPMPQPPGGRPKLAGFHLYMLGHILQEFNDRNVMRRRMEQWVAFVANRQQRRSMFFAHARGSSIVFSLALRLLLWRRYHKWRLWLGLRRKNPKEFGLIPRALVYDPAEPEVGDVETIKDRITYHTNEVAELTGVVQRHHDILDLLRGALQRKLSEEMAELHRMSEQLETDRVHWVHSPESEAVTQTPYAPQERATAISPPPPLQPSPSRYEGHYPQPVLDMAGVAMVVDSPAPLQSVQVQEAPDAEVFSVPLEGYIPKGGDLRGGPKWMHLEDAQEAAAAEPTCLGFTFNLKHQSSDGRFLVYFKNKCDVHRRAPGWRAYSRFNFGIEAPGVAGKEAGNAQPPQGFPRSPHPTPLAVADTTPVHAAEAHPEARVVSPRAVQPPGLHGHPAQPPLVNGYMKDPSDIVRKVGVSALFRRRLLDFYQYHNPSKLPSVMHTLLEFKGHEEALFEALTQQYGHEPREGDLDRNLPPGWYMTESSKGDLFYKNADGRKQWHIPIAQ